MVEQAHDNLLNQRCVFANGKRPIVKFNGTQWLKLLDSYDT